RVLRGERASAPGGDVPPGPAGPTPPWLRLLRVPRPRDIRAALSRNTGLKLVSLLLAFFLWFSINVSERDAEGTIELPLRIRAMAPGLIVTNQPAKPVSVTLRGPRTILDGVDERRARVSVHLSPHAARDQRVDVNPDPIRPDPPPRPPLARPD